MNDKQKAEVIEAMRERFFPHHYITGPIIGQLTDNWREHGCGPLSVATTYESWHGRAWIITPSMVVNVFYITSINGNVPGQTFAITAEP